MVKRRGFLIRSGDTDLMRILITGGTGFLGRHAAIRLQSAGNDVTILGRNRAIGDSLQKRGIRFVQGDLENASAVDLACRGQNAVIHSGGLASPWGEYQKFYAANVLGTENVIQSCRTNQISRLVYLSTPSLYFNYRHRELIRESDPLPKPETAYAATKKIADERMAEAFTAGLPCISIRPRAIFGPGDQSVLVRLIRAGQKGTIPLVGAGRSFVDLTYIDNVVDALQLCLSSAQATLGRVYNITNGEPMTTRQLMEKVFGALGIHARFRKMPFFVAYSTAALTEGYYQFFKPGVEPPLTRYAIGLMAKTQTLDISKARAELGYHPKVSFDEGLDRFAHWWKAKESGVLTKDDLGLPI